MWLQPLFSTGFDIGKFIQINSRFGWSVVWETMSLLKEGSVHRIICRIPTWIFIKWNRLFLSWMRLAPDLFPSLWQFTRYLRVTNLLHPVLPTGSSKAVPCVIVSLWRCNSVSLVRVGHRNPLAGFSLSLCMFWTGTLIWSKQTHLPDEKVLIPYF